MRYYTTSRISENIHETPEGYLVCVGVPIARTGEMIYGPGETPLDVGDDGKLLIQREEEEVFRPETIASFEGKPITITHPMDNVTPANWSGLAKGVLQNVKRGTAENKDDLIADLLITDGVAINLVKNDLREVSCGYDAIYIETAPGKGIQTQIVGNHLALVEAGRAGSSYAIHDHKGKGAGMSAKLKEQIKKIFGKAQDEALALTLDAESDKDDKSKKDDEGDKGKSKDYSAMDELTTMVKDLSAKVDSMMKPAGKDASSQPTNSTPAEVVAKDDEAPAAGAGPSVEDRLAALEASVAKLLERETNEDDVPVDEEADNLDDTMDEEMPASTLTGDSAGSDVASRMEILAPGLKATGKDAKAKCIRAAYATKDGKKVIDALTGGKAPMLDTPERVNSIFMAASELLKVKRTSDFAGTKSTRDAESAVEGSRGSITAEDMNKINAKHYGK